MSKKIVVEMLVIGIIVACVAGMMWLFNRNGDERELAHAQALCREWAAADHSGAVPPERLKWLKENGVWDNFDWYHSCMLDSHALIESGRSK